MEDALKEKLSRVLNSPIETEERVVYFFVELRKLMERSKTKEKYPVVNFYCNWVVHIRLSNSPVADGFVHLIDDGLAEMLSGKPRSLDLDRIVRDFAVLEEHVQKLKASVLGGSPKEPVPPRKRSRSSRSSGSKPKG
jgi:hypothetical protein